MARPFDTIKDLNDSKDLWKIAIRVVDVWTVVNKSNEMHLEMVFMDAQGDRIQVVVPKDEVGTWKTKLIEQNTYVLQHLNVYRNDFQYKACDNPYKGVIFAGTTVKQKPIPEIPPSGFQFKDFNDIINGKFRVDLLVDIIGAVHEMNYCQTNAEPKKAVFTMTDTSGKLISCTLWDDYAIKLVTYVNNGKAVPGPIIIILTHAKIKAAQGNFPASVSNYWWGSKLLINEDIVEVQNFKMSLPANESSDPCSQMLSQFSRSSQFSDFDRFMYQAQVKSIAQINKLKEDTTCVTVGTTGKIIVSKYGWSYEGCSICTKKVRKEDVTYRCQAGHENEAPVARYKLEMRVIDKKDSVKFIFWDADCEKILGKSAHQLMADMFKDGEDDPRAYPLLLDNMCAITLAYRVRYQANYNQCSVIKVEDDPQKIQTIRDQLDSEEHTSKLDKSKCHINDDPQESQTIMAQVEAEEDTSKLDKAKSAVNEEVQFHTQSLSATAEHDPDLLASITPAKRMSCQVSSDEMLSQELASAQLSATKITKQIKIEPKD